MKKVLVISYYWPPSGGSGVQRWVKMCRYLPQFGWKPIVFTPSNPALTSIDNTLGADVEDVEVIRRPIIEPGQFAKGAASAQVTPINSGKKSLKQRIAMWIRGNCFIPDPRVLWVWMSYRWLKKYLREHPVDAIVSTGPPHSMHLLARRLSLATGIPWVADFRDPWTKMFYFHHLPLSSWARRKHEKLEKQVLDDCACVVAVSPLVRDEFAQMTSTPVELITNGYDAADFVGAAPADQSGSAPADQAAPGVAATGDFVLLHAGSFAADGNPERFWEALAALCRDNKDFASHLKIVLCGKTDTAVLDTMASAGLDKFTQNIGYLPHNEVVKLMCTASVLMIPLRKEPACVATIPGKLFEYLASRRPIIGFGQTDGAMARIISDTRSGKTFEWEDRDGMYEYISDCYGRFVRGSLKDNTMDVSAYSRENLAKSYAKLLETQLA